MSTDKPKKPWWKRSWPYTGNSALIYSTTVTSLTERALDFLLPDFLLPPGETKMLFIRPISYQGVLDSSYRVTKTYSGGECIRNISQGSTDPEAHGCFAEGLVLDPCWSEPNLGPPYIAVCPLDPWDHDVVVVHVEREKEIELGDKPREANPNKPWALELAHPFYSKPTRCVFVQGVRIDRIAGMRANYQCYRGKMWDRKTFVGEVAGYPQKLNGKLWRVHFNPNGSPEVVEKGLFVMKRGGAPRSLAVG